MNKKQKKVKPKTKRAMATYIYHDFFICFHLFKFAPKKSKRSTDLLIKKNIWKKQYVQTNKQNCLLVKHNVTFSAIQEQFYCSRRQIATSVAIKMFDFIAKHAAFCLCLYNKYSFAACS